MIDHSVGSTNPLYEKLCSRFSYDGKTVGEMMLARAGEHAAASGKHTVHLCDVTAESSITKANFLPRHTAEATIRRPARPAFSRSRINPSAALAILLAFFIFAYLFIAGINQHTDFATPDVISASAVEVEAQESVETDTQNP